MLSPLAIHSSSARLYNHPAMSTLVTIECNEPKGRDELARQPWSDVSVSFVDGPGGKTYEFEPTLVSRPRLERDLTFERESQRKDPARDRSATIELLEKIVDLFNNDAEFYVDSKSPEDCTPEIYTSNAYIDQAEAEKMLVHFLGTRGFTEVGFQWIWPDVICSVG
jgi:hypothetical protein